MVKVYGCSDDLVEIEGSQYKDDEIGCYNRAVRIWFEDGTVILVGYPKRDLGVWWVEIECAGSAEKMIQYCNDEDADIYSDIFEIDSEIVKHEIVLPLRDPNDKINFMQTGWQKGMEQFKEGEYIIYRNGDRYEIGKIKRIVSDGAFVWYSSGDTASKTPFDCMHKLENGYVIGETSLGGSMT